MSLQIRGGFGLPVFALAGLLWTGCTDGTPQDSEPADDTQSTDTDVEDTGPQDSDPQLQEICDNGTDDDEDGLVDCEDPSCTQECAEDCDNGEDDDADGQVDCDDSECAAEPQCLGGYTVSAEITFTSLELSYGDGVQAELGEQGTARGSGSITLQAVANDDQGTDFECIGNLVADPVAEGGFFGAFSYSETACEGCDYGMTMELTPLWPGGCPVVTLPVFHVAAEDGRSGLHLQESDGSWRYFFRGEGNWSTVDGDRVAEIENAEGREPIVWIGDYE